MKFSYKKDNLLSKTNFFSAIALPEGITPNPDKLDLVHQICDTYILGYSEMRVNIDEILEGVGVKADDCILLGFPSYYEPKEKRNYRLGYVGSIYASLEGRHYIDSQEKIKMLLDSIWVSNPYNFGPLELNFIVRGYPKTKFTLIIDGIRAKAYINDGKNDAYYKINTFFPKDNAPLEIRVKAISHPNSVSKASRMYMEYLDYIKTHEYITYPKYEQKMSTKSNATNPLRKVKK